MTKTEILDYIRKLKGVIKWKQKQI
jgi:hypothetical protein